MRRAHPWSPRCLVHLRRLFDDATRFLAIRDVAHPEDLLERVSAAEMSLDAMPPELGVDRMENKPRMHVVQVGSGIRVRPLFPCKVAVNRFQKSRQSCVS